MYLNIFFSNLYHFYLNIWIQNIRILNTPCPHEDFRWIYVFKNRFLKILGHLCKTAWYFLISFWCIRLQKVSYKRFLWRALKLHLYLDKFWEILLKFNSKFMSYKTAESLKSWKEIFFFIYSAHNMKLVQMIILCA